MALDDRKSPTFLQEVANTKHMSAHNSIYPAGVIKGLLTNETDNAYEVVPDKPLEKKK